MAEGLRGLESGDRWVAPLETEKFREYWDAEALGILGLDTLRLPLEKFWPAGGPHWDALAIVEGAERRGVILVEAKSYPDEVCSSGSQAMAPGSVTAERQR